MDSREEQTYSCLFLSFLIFADSKKTMIVVEWVHRKADHDIKRIILHRQVFKLDMVMMSIVILCLISAALYRVVTFIGQTLDRVPFR